MIESDELEAALRAVGDDDFGRVHRAIILAAAMSGLRMGELPRAAVDRRRLAGAAHPCSERSYVQGISAHPRAAADLAACRSLTDSAASSTSNYRQTAYQADADLVFANPHTGAPLDGAALFRRLPAGYLAAAGVRRGPFHHSRHTFGTRMAAAGLPMRTLQEWMGHRDLRTTLIYADYAPGGTTRSIVNGAFAYTNLYTNLRPTRTNSNPVDPVNKGGIG